MPIDIEFAKNEGVFGIHFYEIINKLLENDIHFTVYYCEGSDVVDREKASMTRVSIEDFVNSKKIPDINSMVKITIYSDLKKYQGHHNFELIFDCGEFNTRDPMKSIRIIDFPTVKDIRDVYQDELSKESIYLFKLAEEINSNIKVSVSSNGILMFKKL